MKKHFDLPIQKLNYHSLTLTLLAVCFILGQFQRIQLGFNRAFYLHDILIISYLVFFTVFEKTKLKSIIKQLNFKNYKLEISFTMWALLSLGIGFLKNSIGLNSLLYISRLIVYSGFIILLCKQIKNLKPVLIYIASMILILGLLQYLFLPDVRFLKIFGWDDHYYRLISTQFDPGFTGIILVMGFILLQSIKETTNFYFKFFKTTISILFIIGIMLTFSRASFVSLWISLMVLQISLINKNQLEFKKLIVYFILSFLVIYLSPKPSGEGVDLARTSTINARIENSQNYLTSIKGSDWILGKGLFYDSKKTSQSLYLANHAHYADNLLIFVLNSTGLIGLSIFIILLIKWGKLLWKKNQYLFSSYLAILSHSFFNASLLQPFVFIYFFLSLNTKNYNLK